MNSINHQKPGNPNNPPAHSVPTLRTRKNFRAGATHEEFYQAISTRSTSSMVRSISSPVGTIHPVPTEPLPGTSASGPAIPPQPFAPQVRPETADRANLYGESIKQATVASKGLLALPTELLQMVAGNLSTGLERDPLKSAWQVHQLQRTHPKLDSAINGYLRLTTHHPMLKKLKALFNTSMRLVPSEQLLPTMLMLMGPDQRREQVESWLKMTGGAQQSAMIPLFLGIAAFEAREQIKIIDAIVHLTDPRLISHTIKHAGPALPELERSQRTALFEAAMSLNLANVGEALIGLASGLASLEPKQRRSVIETILNLVRMDEATYLDLLELGSELAVIESDQRESIVTACLSFIAERDRAEAIAGLGGGLEVLTSLQRNRLFEASAQLTDHVNWTVAMTGLSDGFKFMPDDLKKLIVQRTCEEVNGEIQSNLVVGLSNSLEHLEPEQQLNLAVVALAMEGHNDRDVAIAGLCGKLECFGAIEQSMLFTSAMALTQPEFTQSILALTGKIALLDESQREKLIGVALRIGSDEQVIILENLGNAFPLLDLGHQTTLLQAVSTWKEPKPQAWVLASFFLGTVQIRPT